MKIDKDKLEALCSLSDSEMWSEIVQIGKAHGFTLPSAAPSSEDMRRLRETVSAGSRLNLSAALKIINDYRRKAK